MKPLNLLTVPIVILLSFIGCSKSSDNSSPKTKTQLLTQGSWKFNKATVGGIDASAALQTCQKDNVYVFAAAGTGTVDEGATKCAQTDPQTIPFNWNFETNETVLNVSTVLFAGGGNKFTIVSLTETEFVVSQSITINQSNQTAVVTFIH